MRARTNLEMVREKIGHYGTDSLTCYDLQHLPEPERARIIEARKKRRRVRAERAARRKRTA